ncbi:MAG: RsmB/NOP family class I SAM-dependent RNA methyltransferase [Ignavibacteria bacterium]|nr:RsmB/NOP family class I SAM-dependent RNA methyltransferase [Ignavibacteria bacterium]
MRLESLVGHASEIIQIVWNSPRAADVLVSEFLRSKKYVGSTDRRVISELVFITLRIHSLGEVVMRNCNLVDVVQGAMCYALAGGVKHTLVIKDELAPELQAAKEWCEKNLLTWEDAQKHCTLAEWCCTQQWILDACNPNWDAAYTQNVFRSMIDSAPVGIRVNLRNATVPQIAKALTVLELPFEIGKYSPSAITLLKRFRLTDDAMYLRGAIEIQDEGSQLIGYACGVEPHYIVLDACAGAGGKTLHLADLQNDKGRIIAADIEASRVKEIATRARRAGVESIRTHLWQYKYTQGNRPVLQEPRGLPTEGFDVVLVDAPCSGTGTVRRLPMVKWRLTEDQLLRHGKKQLAMLNQYSKFVGNGGVLVYSTCAIFAEENQKVAERFLKQNPNFEPLPLLPIFEKHGVHLPNLDPNAYWYQADPYTHGTDGLFVATMRKKD